MIVVSSDWHADAMTAGVRRLADITRAAFESAHYAIDHQADAYLFLGDLCNPDTPRAFAAIALAVEVAMRLADGGVKSYWLTGNHDVVEDGSGDSTLTPLHGLCDEVVVCDSPGAYNGMLVLPFTASAAAYDPGRFVDEQLLDQGVFSDYPPRLVLTHLNVSGAAPGTEAAAFPRGREVMLPLRLLRQHWPFVPILCGHYHSRSTDCGDSGVLFVGSLERLVRGDGDEPRGFMVLP